VEPAKPERMLSLDAFRGMTIAGMILVNNPGSWSAVYGPLQHAAWHGWTPTDLVFPFFLFIVGVAITLALKKEQRGVHAKIVRRTVIIIALGLFLNAFPAFDMATLRIPGVLQRIALGYFFAALIYLHTGWKTQARITLGLLFGYWLLMAAGGDLSKEGNLAAVVDRALLGKHIYTPVYDPEGLLSTLPAIATALCGALTGHWLRTSRAPFEKAAGMFAAGTAAVALGWIWDLAFPINKALWTSSYVVFTAGLALQFLALCYWLMDLHGYRAWAKPFLVYGSNALAVYFLSSLAADVLGSVTLARPGGAMWSLKRAIFERLFAPLASPINASLLFALTYVLFWLAMMWLLYRKRIFIKV
jgi:predicted acyltransferase